MDSPNGEIVRVGIDAGGTFTDVVWTSNGRLGLAKVPSRPDRPAEAVLAGLEALPGAPGLLCHGTTVGTNAMLARHGGPARMVVTRGFRDILALGRGEREELYSPAPGRPRPLIGRDEIHELDLRLDASGAILAAPSDAEVADLAETLKSSGAKAVAVCILHSAQHPEPERKLADKLHALTGLNVFASSTLAAFPREYERWSLAALAAYLAPVLGAYLADLTERSPAPLALMASSGGLISPDQALSNPAVSVLSGPAGGALATLGLGRERVLALDMGGTSTDVTLLAGRLPRTREAKIDRLPLPLPTIDIHTIGAGGGSIVKVDAGGMLAVGPESAGADPGPACYGKGGPATLSDVALLSGRLVPERFLGGDMRLDIAAARRALEEACPRGLDLDELLDGVLELAGVHLTGALRRISIARGIDPSNPEAPFTLVPFGGAGALFGVECARALGLREVLHPRAAGVFSALGLMSAPMARESERAILLTAENAPEPLRTAQTELMTELGEDLAQWGTGAKPVFAAIIECRYHGQTHTLDIPLPDSPTPKRLREAFESAYRSRYTYLHPDAEVEIVLVRVRAELPAPKLVFPDIDGAGRRLESANLGTTRLRLKEGWLEAPVYDREKLPVDAAIRGPAIIVEDFATLYLPPETAAHLDRKGHALIDIE